MRNRRSHRNSLLRKYFLNQPSMVNFNQSNLIGHVLREARCRRRSAVQAPARTCWLADDHTPTVPVIVHAIPACRGLGWPIDQACCLYPAVPLIQADDIAAALERERTVDSAVGSVQREVLFHQYSAHGYATAHRARDPSRLRPVAQVPWGGARPPCKDRSRAGCGANMGTTGLRTSWVRYSQSNLFWVWQLSIFRSGCKNRDSSCC